MKQSCLTILLVFGCLMGGSAAAQSYLPFPGQWTSHYTTPGLSSGNPTVVTVRVDSIYPQNGGTTYLFNRIVRAIDPSDTIVTCDGDTISALQDYSIVRANQDNVFGSSCTVYPDGRAEFQTQAGDTFFLETQAQVGDVWTFHGPTGISAECTDIMVNYVYDIEDTVKIFELSSGREIALSKHYGIARGFAFLPLSSLSTDDPILAALTLWGIEDIAFGRRLPNFQHIYGPYIEGNVFQTSNSASHPAGTSRHLEEIKILSHLPGPVSIKSFEIMRESFTITETYNSGGSHFDSTYQAPSKSVLTLAAADYPFLSLALGEVVPRDANERNTVAVKMSLQTNGFVRSGFKDFSHYDPCSDTYYSSPQDNSYEEEFVPGLGAVSRSIQKNGRSSTFSMHCYQTIVPGTGGECLNLARMAGVVWEPPAPAPLAAGVYGNADRDNLLLYPGEFASYLVVWDVSGRKVLEMPVREEEGPYSLDVTSWKPGVYVFQVELENGQPRVFRTGIIH